MLLVCFSFIISAINKKTVFSPVKMIAILARACNKPSRVLKTTFLSNSCNLTKPISWFFKESVVNNCRSYSICKGIHGNNAANIKEIEIPLPYGKIAGKAWGSESATPVLAFHGWLDNCGTFDRLIPLLSNEFYFVTIDAPGHGRSSHLPAGSLYTDMSMVLDFKKTVDYLGWKKFHLMGHSVGGSLALLFTSIFPDSVDKVICLDIVKPFSLPIDAIPMSKHKIISRLLEVEKKLLNPQPVYTTETAPARLKKGMNDEITEEGAKILLQRGAKPSDCGKGLIFNRDLRCPPVRLISVESDEVIEAFMSKLCCKLLMILAKNTHPLFQPETPERIAKFIAMYKSNLQHFVLEHVDGNHFVHLNNPERMAPFINRFLLNGH